MRQIKAIARKEMYHILRDFRSLIIIFVMPIMMTFLYGYAINMDIEHITLAVIDQDRTPESREFDRILGAEGAKAAIAWREARLARQR